MDNRERIERLTAKNDKEAYSFCLELCRDIEKNGASADFITEAVLLLDNKSSLVRTRGFMLLCSASTHMNVGEYIGKMLSLFPSEKALTLRQYISCINEHSTSLLPYKAEILQAVKGIDLSLYKESMASLLKKDIDALERSFNIE